MDSLIAPETYRRKLAEVSFIRRETHCRLTPTERAQTMSRPGRSALYPYKWDVRLSVVHRFVLTEPFAPSNHHLLLASSLHLTAGGVGRKKMRTYLGFVSFHGFSPHSRREISSRKRVLMSLIAYNISINSFALLVLTSAEENNLCQHFGLLSNWQFRFFNAIHTTGD